MSDLAFEIRFEAEAEVEHSEHAAECVAAHPNEPCPGFPHTEG